MLHIFKRGQPARGRRLRDVLRGRSFQTRLRIWLIPPFLIVLILTGYVSYLYQSAFIHEALERTARLQVEVLAQDIETFLASCAEDLRFVAETAHDPAALRNILASLMESSGTRYRELAFISQKTEDHLFFFVHEKEVYQATPEDFEQIAPDPLSFYEKLVDLAPGTVWISKVLKSESPVFSADHPNQKITTWVIYFGTPFAGSETGQKGYLLLAVDVRDLRNILSAHRAENLSIWPYTQSSGKGGSFLFDTEGWILFESEDMSSSQADPGTDMARAGFSGTLGSENLPTAFKPDPEFREYWEMVSETHRDRSGVKWQRDFPSRGSLFGERFVAYAPLRFQADLSQPAAVYGGVAISERTRLAEIAMFKQVDVIFIIALAAVAMLLLLIALLARSISRPIAHIIAALDRILPGEATGPVQLTEGGPEISRLLEAVNRLLENIAQVHSGRQIADREREAAIVRDRTPFTEADLPLSSARPAVDSLPEIMGIGPRIEKLKQEIMKAARSDADVLIIGETGTGKQLAAEAIHRHGRRAAKPFVAINCGELDENLLLDTLFGHVRGAFTEAKGGRKGAFVEADGGILFLDEIQTASPRVQQALLRAIAQRRIKPLGSDAESDIDVRLIAATNADLSKLVDQGGFRQDLYFRLKVVTIATPALRDQSESVPVLAWHYFQRARQAAQKEPLSLTRGALVKMGRYRWPGNVRELINCITRAVVMAEGRQVSAEDILLEGDEGLDFCSTPPAASVSGTAEAVQQAAPAGLNARQAEIYPLILREGGITRSRYQAFWKPPISSRTALYDLQDLVEKGLLTRVGQGPATRYVPNTGTTDAAGGPAYTS